MSEQLAPGAVPTPALTVSTKKRSCSFEGPTPKRSRSAAPSRVQSICGWLAEVKQLDGPVEEEGVWILRAQQKLNSDISNDPDLEKRASIGFEDSNARCVSLEEMPGAEKLQKKLSRKLKGTMQPLRAMERSQRYQTMHITIRNTISI